MKRLKNHRLYLVLFLALASLGCCVYTFANRNAKMAILRNADALMNSEAYYLNTCMMPGFFGEKAHSQLFCNMFTNDYVLFSCETSDNYITDRYNRCVKD